MYQQASLCFVHACPQLALRNSVKKSLQQLSKAINGDAKTEPQTLFKVRLFRGHSTVQ
ncbi:unnamed protein product, partial [Scytosiphon promiscuus]